jgi:ADP-heptose:LPS heptosyltransferase
MSELDKSVQRILVIKHGALGDLVLATGPFKAIRANHFDAHIVLLTTAPFESFGRDCGYFNEVWLDTRPRPVQVGAWLALSQQLSDGRFRRWELLSLSGRES